jgi:hypothetical protein
MRLTATLFGTWISLFVMGQTSPDPLTKLLLDGSATAVLGFLAFWLAVKVIPGLIHDNNATIEKVYDSHSAALKDFAGKMDNWESQRHADHAEINTTVRTLAEQCGRLAGGQRGQQ